MRDYVTLLLPKLLPLSLGLQGSTSVHKGPQTKAGATAWSKLGIFFFPDL